MIRFKVCALALLAALSSVALAIEPARDPVAPDGTRAVVDLPAGRHIRNVGGSDGAGLCVFTSVQHAADWQNVRALDGFREWMRRRPGGGWPQKLDQMFAQFAREKGAAVPAYIQHTGGDDEFLALALKTDRMPCVTYAGRDDFYSGRVAHMVNLAHLDDKRAAIIDNNRPGVWVWMTRAEFLSRWRDMQGGWAVVLLADPPPPHLEAVQAFGACVCGSECKCAAGTCPNKCPVVVGQPPCPNGRCPLPAGGPAGPLPVGDPPTPGHEWRQFDDGAWGWRFKVAAPPVVGTDNFGVASGKIHDHPNYSLCGVPVTKDQALAAMGADGLRDDSDRWHLTAVGSPAFLAAFDRDVAALPVGVRSKLLVQGYAPDHWAVPLYKLPVGVSLRKPSRERAAPRVGRVETADYAQVRLADLLALPGGPVAAPAPAPADPKPAPSDPVPVPTPVPPTVPDRAGWLAALILGALFLILRRK